MNALISRSRTVSKLLLSPTTTLYTSLFSTSSSLLHYRFSSTYHKSQLEKVSVWWDMENCAIPTGGKVFKIVESITEAVRVNGIMGPLQINAFGDISRLNPKTFSNAGVNLVNAPNGLENGADRALLLDLMYWVSLNPPPAHIFLIASDFKFAGILHKLRKSKYNILLAVGECEQALDDLYNAASIIWHWDELVKGENLYGMHFDLLPGRSFSSWYQYYRELCEDPFTMWGQQKIPALDNSSNDKQSFYYKHRPIPVAVLEQVLYILHSYPGGLTNSELSTELEEQDVYIDKGFYGYGTFLHLLLALPYLVDVQPRPEGKFFVRLASIAALESAQRRGISLNITDNKSAKLLNVPLGHDEAGSTEVENSKHQTIFGCHVGAETSSEFFFQRPNTSTAALRTKIKRLPNSKQPHDASDSKHLEFDVPHSRKLDEEAFSFKWQKLFSKDSFRRDLLSFFLENPRSHAILNSNSWEQFAERLEKMGPSILLPLKGNDICKLVDFLVSEEWIKEYPARSPRFELGYEFWVPRTMIFEKSKCNMALDCCNVLVDSLSECRKYLNTKMEAVAEYENYRSVNEMMTYCEKLLDYILLENPELLDEYEDFIKLVALLSIHSPR